MNDEDEALIHKITDLLKYLNESSGRMGDNARFHGVDLRRLSFIVPGAEGFTME